MFINNIPIDLSHLEKIERFVYVDLPRHPPKKVKVEIFFSNHCYTKGIEYDEYACLQITDPKSTIIDGSTHLPRYRVFCPIRYDLSKSLVSHIDTMIQENAIIHKTPKSNHFYICSKDNAYYLFMRIKALKPENKPRFIKISVESAYPNAKHEAAQEMTFSKTLGAIWSRK